MFSTIQSHKKSILLSLASFVLGGLFVFGLLRFFPSSGDRLPHGAQSHKPGAGMAWMQPSPPPQAPAEESESEAFRAAEEHMAHAEKAMREMQKRFFGNQNPFAEAQRMREEMARGGFFSMEEGSQQVVEREDDRAVYYEISGIDQTKLDTSVNDGVLTISGISKQNKGSGGFQVTMQSSFQRSFSLPSSVDESKMEMISEKDKVILKFPKRG